MADDPSGSAYQPAGHAPAFVPPCSVTTGAAPRDDPSSRDCGTSLRRMHRIARRRDERLLWTAVPQPQFENPAGLLEPRAPVEAERSFARVNREVVQTDGSGVFDHGREQRRARAATAPVRLHVDALDAAGQSSPHTGTRNSIDDG